MQKKDLTELVSLIFFRLVPCFITSFNMAFKHQDKRQLENLESAKDGVARGILGNNCNLLPHSSFLDGPIVLQHFKNCSLNFSQYRSGKSFLYYN